MKLILHITTRDAWEHDRDAGEFHAASLPDEGFVHCSTPEQVLGPAQRYFADRKDLLLLLIDADRLRAALRWEKAVDADAAFPHVYGPINLDAVVDVVDFPRGADGSLRLPPEVARYGQGA